MNASLKRWYEMVETKQQYSCYVPEWFYGLSPSQNTFMFYLFKKMRINRKIENIEFRMGDVKNMSRRSFFNAIDTLSLSRDCKERPYLLISKIDKSTYCISLHKESGHYTDQDYEHLTRPIVRQPANYNQSDIVKELEERCKKPIMTMGDAMRGT